MKLRLLKLICLVWVVGLAACSDDKGGDVPPYITDLLTVSTNAEGTVASVLLDNGKTYNIVSQGISSDLPDTLLRCQGIYTLENGKMTVYSLLLVFSDEAIPAESFVFVKDGERYEGPEYLPRDPVKLISMWKSGGYINMHVGVLTTGNGQHRYAFCQDSVGHYSLVHLRPEGDAESYTEQVYLSMPLPQGDEVETFTVYTYNGVETWKF